MTLQERAALEAQIDVSVKRNMGETRQEALDSYYTEMVAYHLAWTYRKRRMERALKHFLAEGRKYRQSLSEAA